MERPDEIRILLYEKARLNPAAFVDFIAGFGGRMKFVKGEKPAFYYRRQKNSRGKEEDAMELLGEILNKMELLLGENE